jgi:hypothetical protein
MVSSSPDVALSKVDGPYPTVPPFDPDEKYPEYCGNVCSNAPNPVYRAVRETFRLLQYDRNHYGSPDWNPLECLIKPGDRVFIKPNLVAHEYGRKAEQKTGDLFSVITHPSVVRAVADYAAIALRGKGSLTIGDNPSIDADFSKLLTATQLDTFEVMVPKWKNFREILWGVPLSTWERNPTFTVSTPCFFAVFSIIGGIRSSITTARRKNIVSRTVFTNPMSLSRYRN